VSKSVFILLMALISVDVTMKVLLILNLAGVFSFIRGFL
jgi:hypothetical protein